MEVLAEDIARRSGLPAKPLAPEALELLARQPWPGNVRELRNTLEQATLMTDETPLEPRHFEAALRLVPGAGAGKAAGAPAGAPAGASASAHAVASAGASAGTPVRAPVGSANGGVAAAQTPPPPQGAAVRSLPERVAELEQEALAEALAATRGNRVAAARLLGISRAAFYDKLARWPEIDKRLR
ncbi:MAG: helix-turn-helix domain-containing protein [Rubrivivax sp.]